MGDAASTSERLLGLLAADAERAWDLFLREYVSLVLQVIRLFERDADRADDCFLFVCEQLRRDDLGRLRRFAADGPASFETWLRAVVRNLCLDWRRHRDHRYRLPRSIARLPELEREAFRCVHQRGLSEAETFHTLVASFPTLTRSQLADALTCVERGLDGRRNWLLLTRRPRLESFVRRCRESGSMVIDDEPPDTRVDLERSAEEHETLAELAAALDELAPADRLLVRMRFAHGLALEEIARLTGRGNAVAVQRALARTVAALRERMTARGAGEVSVKGE